MRQKIVFIALVATMFCSATAYAQKIVIEGDYPYKKIIIDATGMPSDAITAIKKPLTTKGTNTTPCIQDATDLASNINNEKIYQKFEVDGGLGSTNHDWATVINNRCKGEINGSTGWRVPTQREFMLICVLHSQLRDTQIFAPLNREEFYWSATEVGPTSVWIFDFKNGGTLPSSDKIGERRGHVRCIRDI